MKENILVTGCGGDIGQSIGKILVGHKYINKIYGVDISDKNAGKFIYKNFSIGLPVLHPLYFEKLSEFINSHEIGLVVIASEPELRYYSSNYKEFEQLPVNLITANIKSLDIGFDKLATIQFLKTIGLPFPETTLLHAYSAEFLFPVVVKSRRGSGGKTMYVANSYEEYKLLQTKLPSDEYITQELIHPHEGEYTCGLFRGKSGQIRKIIFKRELTGGFSSYGELVTNFEIDSLLDQLAYKLDLLGSINVQLRLRGGIPYVFEINPRFSSTVYFRHIFGFEDLIWSLEDHLDIPLSDFKLKSGVSKFYKGFSEYID